MFHNVATVPRATAASFPLDAPPEQMHTRRLTPPPDLEATMLKIAIAAAVLFGLVFAYVTYASEPTPSRTPLTCKAGHPAVAHCKAGDTFGEGQRSRRPGHPATTIC